jgi:ankyrin repeat protein
MEWREEARTTHVAHGVSLLHRPCAIVETVHGDMASIDMLKLLLEYGINMKNTGVGVAAADEGNVEGSRLLLDYGANLDDRDMSWYPFDEDRDEPHESQGTALYRACRQGHGECAELLLARGADAQAKDVAVNICSRQGVNAQCSESKV